MKLIEIEYKGQMYDVQIRKIGDLIVADIQLGFEYSYEDVDSIKEDLPKRLAEAEKAFIR